MLLLACSGIAQVSTAPDQAPSTLLLHARLAEALAFAGETARQRGWAMVASGSTSVTFEQTLDPEADGSAALLRITATGSESPGGVVVSLAAQEVQPARGTAQDVTLRYRDNLLNALDSLATKWGLRSGARPPAASAVATPAVATPVAPVAPPIPTRVTQSPPPMPPDRMPVPAETPDQPHSVGTWAYYAERYAEGRGCVLDHRSTILEGRLGGAELHRVYCADGRQVLVRCVAGSCGDAR